MGEIKRIDEAKPIRTEAFGPGGEQLFVPAHSIEAESSVLGALLLDNSLFDLVQDVVKTDDFYRHENRLVFGSISSLISARKEADVITVHDHLKGLGKEEEIGGIAYLNSLAQYVPSAPNIARYAEIIREKSVLRKLASVGEAIARSVQNTAGRSAEQLLDEAEQNILSIGNSGKKKDEVKDLDGELAKLIDWLQDRSENPESVTGVRSGMRDLDEMTAGFQSGDLIVIAGRPSMGKTALAMNVAETAALDQKLSVLMVSLEMNAGQLIRRSTGSVGRINQEGLRRGQLSDSDWSRVTETIELMNGHTLDIMDDGEATVASIRAIARRAARRHGGLGLIVVDYLQLLEGKDDSKESRATELGAITRGLKLLAKELNCPVISLSQLNRKVEDRPDKRPVMSDLRDSGAIEQDADVIMFIYRDDYYTKDACREPGVAEIIIAKQRNGPTGMVKLAWQAQYARFDNLA